MGFFTERNNEVPSFREKYNVSPEETQKLVDYMAEVLCGEIYMEAHNKAKRGIDKLLSLRGYEGSDTITVTWDVRATIDSFKITLGSIRANDQKTGQEKSNYRCCR